MLEHHRHIDVLQTAVVAFDHAVLSGGRGPHWPQIFADSLGVQIPLTEARETGALDVVIGAAIATGYVADYEKGVGVITCIRESFAPKTEMKAYCNDRYHTYQDLAQVVKPFWAKQNAKPV